MSYKEAIAWSRYIAKRGSLNIGRRIEQSVALGLVTWINAQGGKANLSDFMPHADRPEDIDEAPAECADINDVFEMLKALTK